MKTKKIVKGPKLQFSLRFKCFFLISKRASEIFRDFELLLLVVVVVLLLLLLLLLLLVLVLLVLLLLSLYLKLTEL